MEPADFIKLIKEAKSPAELKPYEMTLRTEYWRYVPLAMRENKKLMPYLLGLEDNENAPCWQWLVAEEELGTKDFAELEEVYGLSILGMFVSCINNEFTVKMDIATSRLLVLVPEVDDAKLLEFHRAAEEIQNGAAMESLSGHMSPRPSNLALYSRTQPWIDFKVKRKKGADFDDKSLQKAGDEVLEKEIKKTSGGEWLLQALETIAFIFRRENLMAYNEDIDSVVETPGVPDAKSLDAKGVTLFKILSLAQSDDLFQLLGPSNPILDLISDSDERTTVSDECVKYGGCRMFLCRHFGTDDDEEREEIEDWFHGMCENCSKRIINRHESIRLPLLGGGWYGCYCANPTCRIEALSNKFPEAQVRKAHERLLASIEEQLLVTGISSS